MNDNNKIEAAAERFSADMMRYPKEKACMQVGFMRGVDWFIESLWHDASEAPEEYSEILYIATVDGEIVDTRTTLTALYSVTPWRKVVSQYNIDKWCYISDILPNKNL